MEKQINDIKVKPLKSLFDDKTIKHREMFNNGYPNIFISSKKHSGKSTLIFNIIKYCALKNGKTKVRLFSTTYDNDNTIRTALIKMNKYNIEYEIFDNLEPTKEGYNNILDQQLDEIKEEINNNIEKLEKQKYIYPLYLFIFDDFSQYLKNNNSLEQLIKRNRHFRIMTLISSQYIHDLKPVIRQNLNYLILYSEIPINKLKIIYDEFIRGMDVEKFIEIYHNTTEQKYNFLYINCDEPKDIRKNFNTLIKY